MLIFHLYVCTNEILLLFHSGWMSQARRKFLPDHSASGDHWVSWPGITTHLPSNLSLPEAGCYFYIIESKMSDLWIGSLLADLESDRYSPCTCPLGQWTHSAVPRGWMCVVILSSVSRRSWKAPWPAIFPKPQSKLISAFLCTMTKKPGCSKVSSDMSLAWIQPSFSLSPTQSPSLYSVCSCKSHDPQHRLFFLGGGRSKDSLPPLFSSGKIWLGPT